MPSPFEKESYLLERLKERDLRAFDYLYRHNEYWMFLKAYAIVQDEAAAQDLVQELFIDFWEHSLFENISYSLTGYLMRLIRNRALNFVRNEGRRTSRVNAYLSTQELVTPDYIKDDTELQETLNKAISTLPGQARKAFEFHYIEKLSHKQIADIMGLSRKTVSNHIDNALRILRKKLKFRDVD